jgi:ElaB/YqjD/DUF883 family membrane-anchored ribosome-binding protein
MMKELEADLESVLAEVKQYNEKPIKAVSGRIRTKLGKLKKEITGIRSHLVEADKAGY